MAIRRRLGHGIGTDDAVAACRFSTNSGWPHIGVLLSPSKWAADLIPIWRATDVPSVETFVHVSRDALPEGDLKALPSGPNAQQQEANRYHAAVEVTDPDGAVVRSVLDTVNVYTFTASAAAKVTRRVVGGGMRPEFQASAGLFGAGFAETIADTKTTDIQF
jgi:hypothetical protein